MRIGFIGTGNMGSILIHAFINSEAASPSQLVITNRTIEKAHTLQQDYSGLHVVDSAATVASETDIVFICVKPLEFYPLLQNIKEQLSEDQLLVSITSPVSVPELQSIVNCHVARAIPSITNRGFSGASLLTFGDSCGEKQEEDLLALMKKISTPYMIEENIARAASDIVSCGPAFFSYLTQRFINSAVEETEISCQQATAFASEMLIGLGKLLEKEIFTLPTLQEKVCVKGGITGEGISVMERELGDVFNQLVQQTHKKYYDDREKVQSQFND